MKMTRVYIALQGLALTAKKKLISFVYLMCGQLQKDSKVERQVLHEPPPASENR